MKKVFLKNFAKYTGKHLCQSLFSNKVATLRPATLLKKRLWHSCFHVNFAKFQRTIFSQNTSGRLPLNDVKWAKKKMDLFFLLIDMFESWYKWIKRSVLEGNFTKDLSILHYKDINVFIIIIISIVWQDREKYFKWVFYSRISFFFPIFKLFHGFCYNKNLSDISFCPANIYLFKVKNRNNRKR